jgi:hypothetical protein
MRRPVRFTILFLSWSALIALLLFVGILAHGGRTGWASGTSLMSRTHDGIKGRGTEFRAKPTRLSYQSGTATITEDKAAALYAKLPGNWIAPGGVQQDRYSGFHLGEGPSVPAPVPDRVSGWDILGIGFEDRFVDYTRSSSPYFDSIHKQTWYCATIWPVLLLGVLAMPAILQVRAGTALLLRARRNQKAHQHGICPACGYDIRATPVRCPECGRVQYAPTKPTISYPRRMTWLIGGGLLVPPILLLIGDALWAHLQPDSPFRDCLFEPAVLAMAIIYWFAIFAWTIRHVINDLRTMVQAYSE